jgi:hypothetical protein
MFGFVAGSTEMLLVMQKFSVTIEMRRLYAFSHDVNKHELHVQA